MLPNPLEAAAFLAHGGILIYPTETFYALGCVYSNILGIREIFDIKKRPFAKPLPLLSADMEQTSLIIDKRALSGELMQKFWPGPLSLILPAKKISPFLCDSRHNCVVRVSGNKTCRKLAKLANAPLVSTSANISGEQPTVSVWEFSREFILGLLSSKVPVGIASWPFIPCYRPLPSTIAEPLSKNKLLIYRKGAITKKNLEQAGFVVIEK